MTQKQTYLTVFFISLACSIGGIPFAACVSKNAADGGRGGAIGSTIALLFIFVTREYGTKLFVALAQKIPELSARIERINKGTPAPAESEPSLVSLEKKIAKVETDAAILVNRINIDAQGQRVQNIWLAIATCIGTICWGFGDLAAKYWMQGHF